MFRQQRYDECIKEVKSKLKQSPNSLHLLNYQAMAYSALKKDREALNSYQKILKRDPTLAGPYYNMGIILKRNGRTEEAVDSYKKAISNFVNIIEPFLRDVQAKRGIFDYVVVCDETNNTAAIIDNNEFVADIYIKPARSINFIGLTFVATRTGVSFDEVIGNV